MIKSYTGNIVPEDAIALLYLAKYDYDTSTLKIIDEIYFTNAFEALEAYANIPNPASQLASGKDRTSFIKELQKLHANFDNPAWITGLADYL